MPIHRAYMWSRWRLEHVLYSLMHVRKVEQAGRFFLLLDKQHGATKITGNALNGVQQAGRGFSRSFSEKRIIERGHFPWHGRPAHEPHGRDARATKKAGPSIVGIPASILLGIYFFISYAT